EIVSASTGRSSHEPGRFFRQYPIAPRRHEHVRRPARCEVVPDPVLGGLRVGGGCGEAAGPLPRSRVWRPNAFAGLWEVWAAATPKLLTCCLITTTANDLVRPVHDRMPVILPRESYGEWLDPQTPEARLVSLLKPYPADVMTLTEVGPAVNSPQNDGPECLG